MKRILYTIAFSGFLISCKQEEAADLLIYNAKVYTVDDSFRVAEAVAIRDGRILAVGSTQELKERYAGKEEIDAAGKFIYPGFIDAHAHFYGYAQSLQKANLVGTKSWEEVLDKTRAFAASHTEGWLTGRGWDQNDWEVKEFPVNEMLDSLFPDRPVLLTRVDGHAAIANSRALELAGIRAGQALTGGEIVVRNGKPTGLLIDNAVDLVTSRIPAYTAAQMSRALKEAEQNCFAAGLTSIADCGLDFEQVVLLDSLQQKGALKMKLNVMLSDVPKNYEWLFRRGKMETERLRVASFKVYADGALGSRGACLLQPYSDHPDHHGALLSRPEHFDSVARLLYSRGLQMCTHAIGDSGNRTILNIYAKYLRGKNERRWRIEHAQVVHPADFALFGRYGIVPSVQPTHATSDMYWAGQRLGAERERGAYAYKRLLQQNGWLPLGTDFPVEDIAPLKTFYAAVFRMDAKGYPEGGYQPANALTPTETLQGITTWAARASFEEKEKGSLKQGMAADLVMLDTDLMSADAAKTRAAKVLMTVVQGEKVFSAERR